MTRNSTVPEREFYFVSAPMSSKGDFNIPRIAKVCSALQATGINAHSPYENSDPRDLEELVRVCDSAALELLRKDVEWIKHPNCVGVVALEDWQSSSGASFEVAMARELGLPLFTYEEFDGAAHLALMPAPWEEAR